MKKNWYLLALAIIAAATLFSCKNITLTATELQVTTGGTTIYNNGSYSTSTTYGYDIIIFTIKNTSSDTIHLGSVTVDNTSSFNVSGPQLTTLLAGYQTTFTVSTNSASFKSGTNSTTVKIPNDASDTSPNYTFTLSVTLG